jgi:hypothetical protein
MKVRSMRTAIMTAAVTVAAVLGEDMCGPNNDIPCSLYGCGAPDAKGIAGQKPCTTYYPRTCQFTFKSRQGNYTAEAVARDLKKLQLPPVSSFPKGSLSPAISLHSADDDPLVLAATGVELEYCKITKVEHVECFQNQVYRNYDCDSFTKYMDLNFYAKATAGMTRTLSMSEQFSTLNDGRELAVTAIAPEQAVSLYSALTGTATVLSMTCETADTGAAVSSCLMFEAVPQNESPLLITQTPDALQVSSTAALSRLQSDQYSRCAVVEIVYMKAERYKHSAAAPKRSFICNHCTTCALTLIVAVHTILSHHRWATCSLTPLLKY